MVEVKTKEGWQRLTWKSPKKFYPYLSEEEKQEGEDYVHEYAMVSQRYQMRNSLREGEFGHYNTTCEDFTEETKKTIEKFKDDYGWYEGYFLLSDLENFVSKKEKELDKLKEKNILQAIYDETRKITAKLNNEEFKKPEDEEEPFEYYEEDYEWLSEEIGSLKYVDDTIYYIVDEVFGYTEAEDIRVIVVAA
jgi:hypothetical protein